MDEGECQITGGDGRLVQMSKVREGGWNKSRRETFLKVLAETCNVRAASKATGVRSDPYTLRRRDPVFAQLWAEALAIGYERLETLLLQRALKGVNAIDLDELLTQSDAPTDGQEATRGEGEDEGRSKSAPATDGDDAAVERAATEPAAAAPEPEPVRTPRRSGFGGPAGGLVRDDVQLALALLNRRRPGAAPLGGPRKTMTSDEVDALLLKKLDLLARKLKRSA